MANVTPSILTITLKVNNLNSNQTAEIVRLIKEKGPSICPPKETHF